MKIYFSLFYSFDYSPTVLMMLACRLSQRQVFCSVVLNLLTFSKLSLSILCLSIILLSWKILKNVFSFICVNSTPSLNLAIWLFSHLDKQYVLYFILLTLLSLSSVFSPPFSHNHPFVYIYTLSSSCLTLFLSKVFSRSVSLSLFLMSS